MLRIPTLNQQLYQSEFFVEKIQLVVVCQTKYDVMHKRKENPVMVPLFPPSSLDNVDIVSDKKQKVVSIEQKAELHQSYPSKLKEMFLRRGCGQIETNEPDHMYIG